jgi:hypothetical protein
LICLTSTIASRTVEVLVMWMRAYLPITVHLEVKDAIGIVLEFGRFAFEIIAKMERMRFKERSKLLWSYLWKALSRGKGNLSTVASAVALAESDGKNEQRPRHYRRTLLKCFMY